MSSSLYHNLNNLLKADLDAVIKAARLCAEESPTGKTIILLAYLKDKASSINPDRLMMADVRSILDRGHGWRVRQCFQHVERRLDAQYKRFKTYCRLRMKTCCQRRQPRLAHVRWPHDS